MEIVRSAGDDEWERKHVRKSDPETSRMGARSVKMRASSQKAKLLKAFASTTYPMNAEEAWLLTDIHYSACWWHRVTDLEHDGLIDVVYHDGVVVKRRASNGEWRQAYRINADGLAKLREL